ncbi:hypothetical protein L218DRAFT_992922 [Marasmius fiardii PR-910]|nr:hypothetical protein L218DRAFT_992922 [Marasmius fiardii PR-910]
MSNREELIHNAVAFLSDPKSQASPLTQKIQFLEAKGLTPPEIDLAIRQASVNQTASTSYQAHPGFGYPYSVQQWDWRDYFIGAVVSGTLTYGAVSLFKKYLLPHLQPPNTTVYEDDRDALTAQFDAAEALLKDIQTETTAIRRAVEEQKERVDKTVRDVEAVVTEMRQAENTARDEMREIRDEIDTIREMLPKMMEKNKESHGQSMAELQQELKSLKALLMSRGPSLSNIPSPAPLVGRPSIPAWQLSSTPTSSASTMSTPAVDPTLPNGADNEKGKQVDSS